MKQKNLKQKKEVMIAYDSLQKEINKVKPTILDEAKSVVYGDREADYGSVIQNFTQIARLWSAILEKEITPEQVGLCMVAVKISRQCFKPKRDNLIDGAGYFATLEKMENEKISF